MKHIIFALLCIPFFLEGQSLEQQVVATQGNFERSDDMTVSWTIGETFSTTAPFTNGVLTQGFQQVEITVTEIQSEGTESIEAVVYPNPTSSWITVEIKDQLADYTVEIIDMSGRVLQSSLHNNLKSQFNLADYSSGQYLVRITHEETAKASLFNVVKY